MTQRPLLYPNEYMRLAELLQLEQHDCGTLYDDLNPIDCCPSSENHACKAMFRAMCDAAPHGVFATDVDGVCTYTNLRWKQIFGISLSDARRNNWIGTLHPDDREKVLSEWHRVSSMQQDFAMEFRVLHEHGRIVTVNALSHPVFSDSDELIGHVGSIEDITERKAAMASLKQQAELLKQKGALAKVGAWELNLATDTLTWSDQACRIHGKDSGYQPSVHEFFDYYSPESRRHLHEFFDRAIERGEDWDMEASMQLPGNRQVWVRLVGHVEELGGTSSVIHGAIQDITESVNQRQKLEDALERITLATDSGRIGVWEWDLQSKRLEWTPQMFELFGEADMGKPVCFGYWSVRVHADDRKAAEQAMASAIDGCGDLSCEYRIIWPDGSVHHLRTSAHVKRNAAGEALKLLGVSWDVTPLRSLSSELARQHELLHVTLKAIDDAVITTDQDGLVSWLNPSAEKMTGWSADQALGKPLAKVYDIVHHETRSRLDNLVAECLRTGKRVVPKRDALLRSRDGTEHGIENSASPIRDDEGELLGVVLVFRDVTEQRQLATTMTYRATHDALTDLFNRSEFESRLQQALEAVNEGEGNHALMFIDLDQFKLVNDACGHAAGDQLLQQMAKMLGHCMRSDDVLARLGGDEFGVILHDCDARQAKKIAQDICDRTDDFRFIHGERRFRIGASIGLVPLDNRWESSAAVMQAADTACYAAKEAGRNRVHVWYDTDQALRTRKGDMQWATRLEQSLDEGRFVLFAQQLHALKSTRDGIQAEVLIRLKDDTGNPVLPAAFLPAAERFHLASRIDRWVLQQAIDTLAALDDLSAVGMLWVNLSGQSVGDRVFHRDAIHMLKHAGSEVCHRICLEITETAAVTNIADAARFIGELRTLGVSTALDDFGAGASSFGYLKTLPVDILKIDGQFIKDLIDDPLDDAAVRCFVDVAGVVGLKTVAECVDKPELLERVKQIGVDYAQGFLLHEPEPLRELLAVAGVGMAEMLVAEG